MLSMVMMVSFVLPAHANTAGGEFELTDFEIFSIFNGNTIVEQSWNAQLTDEEIESIHEAVLSGTFVQSRAMSNVEVTYLGNVDGLYDVVEIIETTFSAMTRSGEIFEEVTLTRIGFPFEDRGSGGSNDGAILASTALTWIQTSILYGGQLHGEWINVIRVQFFRVNVSCLSNNYRIDRISGTVAQVRTRTFDASLTHVVGSQPYNHFFNFDTTHLHASSMMVECFTPFQRWVGRTFFYEFGVQVTIGYSLRTEPRSNTREFRFSHNRGQGT